MKITEVRLRHLNMDLVAPFTTSFGTFVDKEFILVEVKNGEGLSGWAESVAFSAPWYNEETIKTNWTMLEDFLIPLVLDKEIEHPRDVSDMFSHIRKNNMAKSAIEGAIWDLYAKEKNIPLSMALGGELEKIDVGISIGIQKTVPELLAKIEAGLKDGYKRIKMKIQPGWDVEVIREVRNRYPDIPIMADANSAYRLKDIGSLLRDLSCFEKQPATDVKNDESGNDAGVAEHASAHLGLHRHVGRKIEIPGTDKAPADDHAVPLAEQAMAGRAEDIEPLLSAPKQRPV